MKGEITEILADVTLYPTEKSGKLCLTGRTYACQCWIFENYYGLEILLNGATILPGQTARAILRFETRETMNSFASVKQCLLVDDRVIGECVPVPSPDYFQPPRD